MGTNALSVATPGQDIPADHHNELVQAFLQNIVPRNTNRNAEDLAGSLGTSVLRFLRAYVGTYHIGDAANNLTISEPTPGEIHIYRDTNKEKLIFKNGSFEFHINNNLIMSFTATDLTAPNKFIAFNTLKAKGGKVLTGNFGGSQDSDYTTIFTRTMNGCIAGKKVIIEIEGETVAYTDAIDYRLYVNGGIEESASDTYDFSSKRFEYTIPSNGNYTFQWQLRDYTLTGGSYKIEEV